MERLDELTTKSSHSRTLEVCQGKAPEEKDKGKMGDEQNSSICMTASLGNFSIEVHAP